MYRLLLIVALSVCASVAQAQVLVTGRTVGKGNGVAFVSGDGILTDGIGIANNWGGVEVGIANRVDLFGGGGNFSLLGHQFPYAVAGGLFGLPTQKFYVDASAYQVAIVPLYDRKDTSTSIINSAIVMSKTFTLKWRGYAITPYIGASWLYSLGPKDRILSIPHCTFQVPLGVSVPLGKKFGVAIEYDQGTTKSFGFALSYSFRFREQRSP